MERFKIYGPPGTGKTTYLLGRLSAEFKNVHPSECAFVSFTRKGTYEGVGRAQEKFKLATKDLRYFKTIHALAFAEIGARKIDIIQSYHYKQFSEVLGLKFVGFYTEDLTNNNDQYLFADYLERNNKPLYMEFTKELDVKKLKWVKVNYHQFKKQLNLLDYTDLLERYLESGNPLPVKVAFVDEAQDLTTLQWEVISKMFSNAERLYVAGDDEQAIYQWSGADVERFLEFEGKETVLAKSFRLPEKVWEYSRRVSENIYRRKVKAFQHNGHEGELRFTNSLKDCELKDDETTLILSRNNCYLKTVAQDLKNLGKVFNVKGEPQLKRRALDAIKIYTAWTRGNATDKEISLYRHYFTRLDKEAVWFDVMDADKNQIEYYRNLIANQTLVNDEAIKNPKINLETIHSAKGSEADNVIMLLDITGRVFKNLKSNPDSEYRCQYVGATRAKKSLTVVLNSGQYGFPSFQE
jgi:superfamily I DNA/RNA helicase